MLSVFLSHNHEDQDFAGELSERLLAHGIRTWLAEAEMYVGDSLVQKISTAIAECTYLGVVLSPASIASPWVQKEVEVAMNQEILGKRVKVLPLLYKHCELPPFLAGKLYADFTSTFENGFNSLLERLRADLLGDEYRSRRLRERLILGFQDWTTYGKGATHLLDDETLTGVTREFSADSFAVDVLEYVLASLSRSFATESRQATQKWIATASVDGLIIAFNRVLLSAESNVRRGAALLASELAATLSGVIEQRILEEDDLEVKRILVRALSEVGRFPQKLAQALANEDDWIIDIYAQKAMGSRIALLISDGTEFADELGRMAEDAGFAVVSAGPQHLRLVELAIKENEILAEVPLVLLVRGEHYSSIDVDGFYHWLNSYILTGGKLLATSWVSWETRENLELSAFLPFRHVRDGYHEDQPVTCIRTNDLLAVRLFEREMVFNSSFELISAKPGARVLSQMSTGIPLFGYRPVGAGTCYYLNACQHSCGSRMKSPFIASSQLRLSIQRVISWIAEEETQHR
jgi:hypothetical protein